MSTSDLYVYYRARCDDADELRGKVIAMQAALAKEYRVATSLKRRPDEKDNRHTWMEVYQNIPENFDTILNNAATRAGLALLIDGERHIEHFWDLSICA